MDRNERAGRPGRMGMNRPRDQFLSRSAFTDDEHRRFGGRDQSDPLEDLLHRGAGSQQALRGRLGTTRARAIDRRRGAISERPAKDGASLLQIERLGQIIPGSIAEGRNRIVKTSERGDHDDRRRAG